MDAQIKVPKEVVALNMISILCDICTSFEKVTGPTN
jgi:hypothetical protein